jgi:hypothetical protein
MLNVIMKFLVPVAAAVLLVMAPGLLAQDEKPAEATASQPAAAERKAKPKMPDEVIYESSVGEVRFPHRAHVKKKCVTCHHQIHAEALVTPHDDYLDSAWINCQTCHTDSSQFTGKYYRCSDCHHPAPQNISDETLSAKVVTHESCWKCHQTGTGVKASQSCGECHQHREAAPPDTEPSP